MPRPFVHTVTDRNGDPVAGALVTVRRAGRQTPIVADLRSDRFGVVRAELPDDAALLDIAIRDHPAARLVGSPGRRPGRVTRTVTLSSEAAVEAVSYPAQQRQQLRERIAVLLAEQAEFLKAPAFNQPTPLNHTIRKQAELLGAVVQLIED